MSDRNMNGTFAPGNPGGPGRPRRGVERQYLAAFAEAGAHVVACGRNEAQVEGAVFVTGDIRKPPEAERIIALR